MTISAYALLLIVLFLACIEFVIPQPCIENCECGYSASYGGEFVSCTKWQKNILPNVTTTLIISDSNIETITESLLQDLSNLKRLHIIRSNVKSIEENAFVKLTQLTELILEGNSLTFIGNNQLNGLVSLKVLKVIVNEISGLDGQIFKATKALTYVDLSSNLIQGIPTGLFNNLPYLVEINLSQNLINYINVEAFKEIPKLESLYLNNNKLQSINKVSVGEFHCVRLDLSSNKIAFIEDFSFSGIFELQDLNLQNNKLTNIQKDTFGGLSFLKKLNLAANNLAELSPDSLYPLVDIEEIRVINNKIHEVDWKMFLNFKSLVLIDMSKNLIEFVNLDHLGHSTKLKTVNLNENEISKVRYTKLSTITAVNLESNELSGECQTLSAIFLLLDSSRVRGIVEFTSPAWMINISVENFIYSATSDNKNCVGDGPCFYEMRIQCNQLRSVCPSRNNEIRCTCFADEETPYLSCTNKMPCNDTIKRSCSCPEDACSCENVRCLNNGQCIGVNDQIKCECPSTHNGTYCEQSKAQPLTVDKKDDDDKTWDGKMVGLIIMIVVVIVLLVLLAYLLFYKRTKEGSKESGKASGDSINQVIPNGYTQQHEMKGENMTGHYEVSEEEMGHYESLHGYEANEEDATSRNSYEYAK